MQRLDVKTVIVLAMAAPICGCDQPTATAEQPASRSMRADDGCAGPYYYDMFGAASSGRIYCSTLQEPCASQDGKARDACA